MSEQTSVDVQALHAALDATRTSRGLSWRHLAKEVGVSPSTISRMANGLRPDVTAFAAMTTWLGMSADDFIIRPGAYDQAEPELVSAVAPLLRARRDLSDTDVRYLEEIIGAAARRFEAERGR